MNALREGAASCGLCSSGDASRRAVSCRTNAAEASSCGLCSSPAASAGVVPARTSGAAAFEQLCAISPAQLLAAVLLPSLSGLHLRKLLQKSLTLLRLLNLLKLCASCSCSPFCVLTTCEGAACVLLACDAAAAEEVCAVPVQILCAAAACAVLVQILCTAEEAEAYAGRDGAFAAEEAGAAVRRARARKLSLFRQALNLLRSLAGFRKRCCPLLQLLELLCTSLFSSFVCTSLLQR